MSNLLQYTMCSNYTGLCVRSDRIVVLIHSCHLCTCVLAGSSDPGSIIALSDPLQLLFSLRCLERHQAVCHMRPALPAMLRAAVGPSHEMVEEDPAELAEVIDLTADDVVTIDVEAFVIEVLMTKEVKAEPGAKGVVGAGQRPGVKMEPV